MFVLTRDTWIKKYFFFFLYFELPNFLIGLIDYIKFDWSVRQLNKCKHNVEQPKHFLNAKLQIANIIYLM
jgi:hypothetical protein